MSDAYERYMELAQAIEDNNGVPCEGEPEAFFIEPVDENRKFKMRLAKALCAECPVKFQCLEYALESNEREGIWGGATPKERQAIRRGRRAA